MFQDSVSNIVYKIFGMRSKNFNWMEDDNDDDGGDDDKDRKLKIRK